MFRKALVLTAVVLVFAASNLQAEQIQCTWVGGESGCWCEASNWDCGAVPDNNLQKFVVTIDSNNIGVEGVEIGLLQGRRVNQLDCYGKVDLETWGTGFIVGWIELILEDPNGLTNYGELAIDGFEHQFYINGSVTNTVGAMLELTSVEIKANLHNLVGASIEVELENDVEGQLQNQGTIKIGPASDLLCDSNLNNTGLINIYGGELGVDEILDNNSTGLIRGFGVVSNEQLLRNKGRIYSYGGSLAIESNGDFRNLGSLGNWPASSLGIRPVEDVNNQGTIEVHGGGGVAFDCNVVNEPNAFIQLRGGFLAASNITQKAGATFEGFGGITGDVEIDANALIQLTGPTNIVGDVNIAPGATLAISDGTTLITGHTTCNGTIHIKGGRIIPQGGLSGACNIVWEPGTYSNIADFNLDGQVNFKDFAYFADTWLWRSAWR